MNLHEYQSKRRFARFGIPVLPGDVATTPEEARQIAREIGGPVVVKSQVLVGGRGKAGGVKLAQNPDEAEERATQILGMSIKGQIVHKVLVDPAAKIATEIYLGITNDRAAACAVMMASSEGGVEIEQVASENPDAIVREPIEPAPRPARLPGAQSRERHQPAPRAVERLHGDCAALCTAATSQSTRHWPKSTRW